MDLELTLQTAEMKSSMRATASATQPVPAISSDWRQQLPVLMGEGITLRELRMGDAPALLTLLTTEEVTRFISPPPTTAPRPTSSLRVRARSAAAPWRWRTASMPLRK